MWNTNFLHFQTIKSRKIIVREKVSFATWHVNFEYFRAAGPLLLQECRTLDGCPTGQAKITCGYRLPAKFVIATAGPMGEHPDELQSCYENCLKVMKENNLRSIVSNTSYIMIRVHKISLSKFPHIWSPLFLYQAVSSASQYLYLFIP